uniref:SWIM-type domain-containing protein n=1 Tax=Knipowitschia caucasica TaxID=637954 RepID=A0AAV2JB71_KNICA
MRNKMSLEAYIYFQSGWVENILCHFIPQTRHTLLLANVKPSQRVNDQPHKPWVALTAEGKVTAGHCTCMAGLGESCSHVAALLFKVEAFVRLGLTKETCTDVACKWNNDLVEKVTPDPVVNFLIQLLPFIVTNRLGK